MDLNLIVIAGRVAATPEFRSFDSGGSLMRILVTVRSSSPRRRVDVIPVSMWDPAESLTDGSITVGTNVLVIGAVQRRFWSASEGRRSRLEVVAHEVSIREDEESIEGSGMAAV